MRRRLRTPGYDANTRSNAKRRNEDLESKVRELEARKWAVKEVRKNRKTL